MDTCFSIRQSGNAEQGKGAKLGELPSMPLRKPTDTYDEPKTTGGNKFPPEAYAYDSDITDRVVNRVRSEAEKIMAADEWVPIDGVGR